MSQAMNKTANIQARIDPQTKKEAQTILEDLHITLSQAIGMFLKQVVYNHGLPFELKVPNEVTTKTLADAEKGVDVHEVSTVEELIQELDK